VTRKPGQRFDERGLKIVLAAFFVALAVPAGVLIAQAYSQLKWQAFRSSEIAAEELAARIDASLTAAIAAEDARSFGAYSFLVAEGDAAANFVQRSPLSAFPVESAVPGVLGYFQVDSDGKLTTPLLPEAGVAAAGYGITAADEAARAARVAELRAVLARNQLVRQVREEPAAAPAEVERRFEADAERADAPVASLQANFDRLAAEPPPAATAASRDAAGDELREQAAAARGRPLRAVQAAASQAPAVFADERQKRVEETLVVEPAAPAAVAGAGAAGAGAAAAAAGEAVVDSGVPAERAAGEAKAEQAVAVRTFASEVDPFELGVLDAEHLVLFRNVWRGGRRYVQGALVDRAAFVAEAIAAPFRTSTVASVSRLEVALQGRTVDTLAARGIAYRAAAGALEGQVLHRARLSPPFGDVELAFLVDALPRAPGALLLGWVAVTLAAVLLAGFYSMYRFGAGQMRLARQQQDFVSAVSHELKTPLTSIRMYGEMLKSGWADEAKRQTYYDYIHSESERLSRLIENVLQLARLTRNTQRFDLKSIGVAELMDLVRSKVATQVERAGFALEVRNETPAGTAVVVDVDCAAQIFINLVDNALKFSANAGTKRVEVAARRVGDGGVLFTVRDYGPGVPKAQMKRIFELFYRVESGLTRETVGTGIGLALVRELAAAMGARVDVRNCEPGAELRVQFPPA
jgi:signal transduction histidine kinase